MILLDVQTQFGALLLEQLTTTMRSGPDSLLMAGVRSRAPMAVAPASASAVSASGRSSAWSSGSGPGGPAAWWEFESAALSSIRCPEGNSPPESAHRASLGCFPSPCISQAEQDLQVSARQGNTHRRSS